MTVLEGNILGYHLCELLYDGSRILVYRGMRCSDQQPVVIKLLKNPYPNFTELVQFRNQYTIAKNLDASGIVRPYSLETYQNAYALVMEDFGGISLRDYLITHELNLYQFLNIAIQLTEILDVLIRARVIHKDIKPANILIHPESQQVKLIDFSIASLLPKETQEIQNPNLLEGTLAYLAPEQTGRMNRGIDYRSDFYSLGVTFYELLTGQLPFQVDDPLELVHCHIAKYPTSVHSLNPKISPVLSRIIEKLMAKNAEDRYQSALGLKYDLERCWQQLQNKGQIQEFVIAQQDITDRFVISEKLYGREEEVKILLNAFERVAGNSLETDTLRRPAAELMLVAGFSGIGKTAVVSEVHKPIVRQRGYFIKGKFDQYQRNIPLSAFVQAFRDLMGQLLSETDIKLQQWKTRILDTLGENAQVIIEVIPELEQIIGKQPAVTEISGSAAQNRFSLLFQKFIKLFATIDHPLVIFIDDLQWADTASLKLMQLLLSEAEIEYLLLIGAYRDNEVWTAHPLMLTLDELQKHNAIVNTINLTPLKEIHINQLIADTLSCSAEIALPLTQLVYQKTKGNPFFSNQLLKALYDDKLITFNYQKDIWGWQCDITKVKAKILTDDVVEFMALQLQKLPQTTQNVLKLAACIGNQFDLKTLAIVCEQSEIETAAYLWKALQEGLILPQSEVYKFFSSGYEINNSDSISLTYLNKSTANIVYKFIHDRVQQAAYSLILDQHQQAIHLKIGRLLLKEMNDNIQDDKIFEIIGHLNKSINLITQPQETEELARLNLLSAQKAKACTAYSSSIAYLLLAVKLLNTDCWSSQYILALHIYQELAELAYLNGNFEQVEIYSEIVIKHAKTLLDCIKVYEVKIQAYAISHNFTQAIQVAIELLQLLEINLPTAPSPEDIQQAILTTTSTFVNKAEELSNMPAMTKPEKLAAAKILSRIASPVYITQPELFPIVVLTQIQLSFDYGFAPSSAYAYSCYAIILCGLLGDYDTGYKAVNLALEIHEKFPNKEFTAKVMSAIYVGGTFWKQHLQDGINPLLNAYQVGVEIGDLEFAAYCALYYTSLCYFCGYELSGLAKQMNLYIDASLQFKQQSALNYQRLYLQPVLYLLGNLEYQSYLDDQTDAEKEIIPLLIAANDTLGLCNLYVNKLKVAYLFSQVDLAFKSVSQIEKYASGMIGLFLPPIFNFYSSLTHLSGLDSNQDNLDSVQNPSLLYVKANQQQMSIWAKHAPMNFLHKFYLVEAETYRVLSKKTEAIEYYEQAIAFARQNQYLQEEALAWELAAKFYLDWDKQKIAQTYMTEAYYCYARWGAKAKINDLETHYPQLLQPILQQKLRFYHNETSATYYPVVNTIHQSTQASSSSSNSISEALDFASILKASQTLSGEIHLDKLLTVLLNIVIKSAGASKCVLMLQSDDDLQVEAVAQLGEPIVLKCLTVYETNVPISVVYHVKRSLQTVVINDATKESFLLADPYIIQQQPKSLLCTPILNQNKLLGVFYLENHLTIRAFTQERVEVINLLCSQAAISLENARLYQKSQNYAQELENVLNDLKQAQTQLVQSEKMSSLGNLVAGVAHEVNNPIGFLKGSLNNAQEYVKDLLDYIRCVHQNYPQLAPAVEEFASEIDLDFLACDLPKLITSMKSATERIKDISNSLRIFSRADTNEKVACDIHEGIDSTLLILKYRLKANEFRPAIEVIKEYTKLPPVKCFLGQLNQVFMNILANAIDAIDEQCQNYSFDELTANPKYITITTEACKASNTAVISIKDNGSGMSETVKARIFDHLFTTKDIGKGTGLGLAIARQIVEQTHAGKIICNSAPNIGTEFIIELPFG
ncbi:MAG: AAA family ATPase [Calothrix sp. C42_A2020_038]|nr:AAA family ATPase [Calothrix sp. C42_A2020_038]